MTNTKRRTDEDYMQEALRLARESRVLPYPNPWVGCAIVREGKIVGRGFHRGSGTNHAEIEALAGAGRLARNSTLYVNLEPCCHDGRTPPCTDAILRSGIRRVVYAIRDPNPLVAGRGRTILKRGGVEVVEGVLKAESAALNEVYLKFRRTGLPFVSVKVATSLDGKIATRTGESRWITDAVARRRARRLRAGHQAVLVGINTVLADDPHLGPRLNNVREPWRVVLDSRLRIPLHAQVLGAGPCIVATTTGVDARKVRDLERIGAEVWAFRGKRVPLAGILKKLARRGILSVLVEGGGEVIGNFMDRNLADRMFWFFSPMVIGSKESRTAVAGRGAGRLKETRKLLDYSVEFVGRGWLVRGNVSHWALRSCQEITQMARVGKG